MAMWSAHVLTNVNMIITAVKGLDAVQMDVEMFAYQLFQVGVSRYFCNLKIEHKNVVKLINRF